MFATAVAHAHKFTAPVVISSKTLEGKVASACGAFVVINNEGWIVTAAHVFDAQRVLAEHRKAHAEYLATRKTIENDTSLKANKKRKMISRLPFSENWLESVSLWWGNDRLKTGDVHMNLLADIAITRLQNFNPAPDQIYPVFGNPSAKLPPGTSLCKIGFPFHSIQTTFDDTNRLFRFEAGALPIPWFALDGIVARYQVLKNQADKTEATFLQMSTPGLKGQSGGPVFDKNGIVWGIQVRTESLELGFQPEITKDGKRIAEHQFLNVGIAAYVSELFAMFQKFNVKHDVANA